MSGSVKNHVGESEGAGALCPTPSSPDETALKDGPHQDRLLVDRCCAGEVSAWEDLHNQCHDPLLALIKGLIRTADADLIDEIAARVWYALVANDGALLARFDASRGARLITFMRAIARDEAKRYFRSEVRRKERETIATRRRSSESESQAPLPDFLVEEFLTTLSPADRTFCLEHVLASPAEEGSPTASHPAGWQHTRRLYKKLLAFLGRES